MVPLARSSFYSCRGNKIVHHLFFTGTWALGRRILCPIRLICLFVLQVFAIIVR